MIEVPVTLGGGAFVEAKVTEGVFPVTLNTHPVISVVVSGDSVSATVSTSPVLIPLTVVGAANETVIIGDPELAARVDEIEDDLGDTGKDFAAHFTSLLS
jgi:hypothetical protein